MKTRSGDIMFTSRLMLRDPVMDDAAIFVRLLDNFRVSGMTSRIPHPYTLADAEAFVAWAAAGNARAMVLRDRDEPIGCIGVETKADSGPPELGYWLGEPCWGRGYATEAARAMLAAAFADPSVDAVRASCRTVNPGSRRVLEKCGFRFAGPGEMRSAANGGTSVPTERYLLDRAAWRAAAAQTERRAS